MEATQKQKLEIQHIKMEALESEENPLSIDEGEAQEIYMIEDTEIKSPKTKYEGEDIFWDEYNSSDHINEPNQDICNEERTDFPTTTGQRECMELYQCEHPNCGKSFRNNQMLKRHIVIHSENRPHECKHPGCNKSFKRKNDLNVHMRVHSTEKPFTCFHANCGKTFKAKYSLKAHIKEYHQVDCDEEPSQVVAEQKLYKCEYPKCGKSFRNIHLYNCHIVAHSDERPFKCGHVGCTKAFKRQNGLIDHWKVHSDATPFKCVQSGCKMTFKRKNDLTIHMKVHSNDRPFQCKIESCGKKFKARSSLRKHVIRRHHLDDFNEELEEYIASANVNEKVYKCEHPNCGKSFRDIQMFNTHVIDHNDRKIIECENAGSTSIKSVERKNQLNVHMGTGSDEDEKCFVCSQEDCGRVFEMEDDLKIHMRMHRSEVLKCNHPGCKETFKNRTELFSHQRTHSFEMMVCDYPGCNSIFRLKRSFYNHKRKHNYHQYDDSSLGGEQLKNKIRLHTRERFICSFDGCGKSYSRKDRLNLHQKTHGGKNYSCDYENCMETFTNIDLLNKHLSSHQKKEVSSDEDERDFKEDLGNSDKFKNFHQCSKSGETVCDESCEGYNFEFVEVAPSETDSVAIDVKTELEG